MLLSYLCLSVSLKMLITLKSRFPYNSHYKCTSLISIFLVNLFTLILFGIFVSEVQFDFQTNNRDHKMHISLDNRETLVRPTVQDVAYYE